jgi:polysaccharide export outer membrane protein
MRKTSLLSAMVIAAFFTLLSCASKKDMVYLQNIEKSNNSEQATSFEPKLKADDLLSIIVSAGTPELTMPFNMPQIQGNYSDQNNQSGIKTYLIDSYGNIEFPVIGTVKLGGLTRTEAINTLQGLIKPFIEKPSINLRILNFKISVLGEVIAPGVYTTSSERITLLEALGLAGDLTIYGVRQNILVIRETDGKKAFNRIDITQADFMNSPYYYLTQNDVIVVEPNQTRMNASVFGPNLTFTLSVVTFLTTVAILIFK